MDKISKQKALRDERRILAYNLLGSHCVKCGVGGRLQFDHIDPSSKIANISELLSSSFSVFMAELKKCQLLCWPCHNEKTLADNGRTKASEQHGTLTAYSHGKCRCDLCRKAWNAKTKEYKKRGGVAQR